MKKLAFSTLLIVFSGLILSLTTPVLAIPSFEVEFKQTYYKPDSNDANEKKLAAAIESIMTGEGEKKTACNLCHTGNSKKMRNDYGKALDELLDKKADKDNSEKIQAALKKVADQKSPAGPTFGELLKKGELPGGTPK
jgi:intergrase/recombinase